MHAQMNEIGKTMILQIYTIIHTLISLVAIFTGIVVVFGMLAGNRLDGWTKWFLITAVATTITGFFFPFHGFTPRDRSWHHIAAFFSPYHFCALSQTTHRNVAMDLCDRCRDLSVF
jgi:hypothetical protein